MKSEYRSSKRVGGFYLGDDDTMASQKKHKGCSMIFGAMKRTCGKKRMNRLRRTVFILFKHPPTEARCLLEKVTF